MNAAAFTSRQLYPQEIRLLKKIVWAEQRRKPRITLVHYFFSVVIAVACLWLAKISGPNFLGIIFAIAAAIFFAVPVLGPWEAYKMKKRSRLKTGRATYWLEKNSVDVCRIEAIRSLLAKEYEDEGDLIVIEYEPGKVLYLWEFYDGPNEKKFPAEKFEMYEERFAKLIGRRFFPLGSKKVTHIIDKDVKWAYLNKYGPEHMATEEISFEEVLARFENCKAS